MIFFGENKFVQTRLLQYKRKTTAGWDSRKYVSRALRILCILLFLSLSLDLKIALKTEGKREKRRKW